MANRKGSFRKYNQDFPKEMLKAMRDGALDCHICRNFKISSDTFYRWLEEIPDFKEAHDEGMPACEAWWCDKGMEGMSGKIKGFNAVSWIMFMNNKFKWAKNANQEQGNTININQMNVIPDKSRQGLLDYIQKSISKNRDIIDVELIESKPDQERTQFVGNDEYTIVGSSESSSSS